MKKTRQIAIHLPQFYPFKENNEWWGTGFTEWTNVTKAKPFFKDHYQPHLPAHLGFYDLRLEESRLAQEALARSYEVNGFCYYHYWFNGKRLLNEPIDRKLRNPKEDLPFMLCWANENWARTWDGADKDILLAQNYSQEDDIEHIKFLIEIFKDERYIKIDGKPVICIYKSSDLPDIKNTLSIWRKEASKQHIELYICRMDRWSTENGKHIISLGFDAAIEFQPLSESFKEFKQKHYKSPSILQKIWNRLRKKTIIQAKNKPDIIDYKAFTEYDGSREQTDYKIFPCVSPGWDNTSRKRENGMVFINSTPEAFYDWTKTKLKKFIPYSKEENLFFINAWNEWAEGNHLEPCHKYGLQYLEMLKKAVEETNA